MAPLDRHDRAALILLALGLAARLFLAWYFPLGNDESYAIAAAREFSFSFFDHPPLAFWLAGLSAGFLGEGAFAYRLPFALVGTATAVMLWRLGRHLGGSRVGFWTLLLWSLAPHMLAGSGFFVLPDVVLNAFCVGAALVLAPTILAGGERASLRPWLGAGVLLAGAMATKYQAGLFAVGVLLFLLVSPGHRRWLGQGAPWIGALVGLLGLLPLVFFGLATDWASFRFHAARTGGALDLANLGRMVLGQFGYLGLMTVPILIAGIAAALRSGHPLARFLLCLSLPQILFFVGIYAFGTDTFPHWTMPGWTFALPLAAAWLCQPQFRRGWARSFAAYSGVFWILSALGFVQITTGAIGRYLMEDRFTGDQNTEFLDLSSLAPQLSAGAWWQAGEVIAVDSWATGGKVSTALAGAARIRVLGPDPRHFQFHSAASVTDPPLLILLRTEQATAELDLAAEALVQPLGARITQRAQLPILRGPEPFVVAGVYRLAWD